MFRTAAAFSFVMLAIGCAPQVGDIGPNGDTGPDAGTTGGDPGPDASCPDVHFSATQTVPSIQLLIDRSGSMGNSLGGGSRYSAMHDALVGSNGVVTQLQDKVYFGAALYSSDSPCPKLYNSQPRAVNNLGSIKSLIESQSPGGNTPTPPAIDQTVADFQANPPPAGSPPVIVLATDGLPNSCSGTDTQAESVVSAKAAYAAGIRLFILGIAGVNDQFLQDMANAGAGVTVGQTNAPYYTAGSPADLQMAFQQIIGGVLSCDLAINGQVDPAQASNGTVTLNGQTLTYGTDWTVVNGTTIELLGQACEDFKSSSNPTVDASFPCGSVIL